MRTDGVQRHGSGTPFEAEYGYCRATRAGDFIFVSGTTAPGESVEAEFAAAAVRVKEALKALGSDLSDVVSTVVYVRDMSQITAIAAAHRQVFGAAPPASTVVQVSGLTPLQAQLELQVTAFTGAS